MGDELKSWIPEGWNSFELFNLWPSSVTAVFSPVFFFGISWSQTREKFQPVTIVIWTSSIIESSHFTSKNQGQFSGERLLNGISGSGRIRGKFGPLVIIPFQSGDFSGIGNLNYPANQRIIDWQKTLCVSNIEPKVAAGLALHLASLRVYIKKS